MTIESLRQSILALIAHRSDQMDALGRDVSAVENLTRNLYRCLIKKSEDNTTVELVTEDEDAYATVSFHKIVKKLGDKILFVDEAIPAAGHQNEGRTE